MQNNSAELMQSSHGERLGGQADWLALFPKDFSTILDVGAGSGAHCLHFRDAGYVPTALDTQPHWFRHHGDIEFLEGDIYSLDTDRQFDAVFCSHALEHMPNPQVALQRMRALVKDGGYLFLVVPGYSPLVANDHWNTGWNCPQLAMWLVASGFDCSDATFMEMGVNICGWGRKMDFPATKFNVDASLPYLPKALAGARFQLGDNSHFPDAIQFDATRITPRPKNYHVAFDDRFSAHSVSLDRGRWTDHRIQLRQPIDLTQRTVEIVSVTREAGSLCRIAMTDSRGNWDNHIEFYLSAEPGMSHSEMTPHTVTYKGVVDITDLRHVLIGGIGTMVGVDGGHYQVWLTL